MRALVAAGAAVAVLGAAAAASAQEAWTAPAAEQARKNPLPADAKSWAVIHYLRSLKK
jgi:hypothetical protein